MPDQMTIPDAIPALIEQLKAARSDMARYSDAVDLAATAFKSARKKLPEFGNAVAYAQMHKAHRKAWDKTHAPTAASNLVVAIDGLKKLRAELKEEAEKMPEWAELVAVKGDYEAAKAASLATVDKLTGPKPDDAPAGTFRDHVEAELVAAGCQVTRLTK